jgi:hypothetical protein
MSASEPTTVDYASPEAMEVDLPNNIDSGERSSPARLGSAERYFVHIHILFMLLLPPPPLVGRRLLPTTE